MKLKTEKELYLIGLKELPAIMEVPKDGKKK